MAEPRTPQNQIDDATAPLDDGDHRRLARVERALDPWQKGLREFVLRHLIRLTGFYETAPYVDPERRPVESWLRPFSWCPSDEERRSGFGFSQYYYKRRDTKRVGKFREADRTRI